MQDPEAKEIIELLSRLADIKSRLRQLESARSVANTGGVAPLDSAAPGALLRAKTHLELALAALGMPTWGFASTPASSLKITGVYSSEIYKALKDIRTKTRGETESTPAGEEATGDANGSKTGNRRSGPSAGRRKADRMSQRWSQKGKHQKKSGSSHAADEVVPSPEDHRQRSGATPTAAHTASRPLQPASNSNGGRADE